MHPLHFRKEIAPKDIRNEMLSVTESLQLSAYPIIINVTLAGLLSGLLVMAKAMAVVSHIVPTRFVCEEEMQKKVKGVPAPFFTTTRNLQYI